MSSLASSPWRGDNSQADAAWSFDTSVDTTNDNGFIDLRVAIRSIEKSGDTKGLNNGELLFTDQYNEEDEEEVGLAMYVESLQDAYDASLHLDTPSSLLGEHIMSGSGSLSETRLVATFLMETDLEPFDFSVPAPAPSLKKHKRGIR